MISYFTTIKISKNVPKKIYTCIVDRREELQKSVSPQTCWDRPTLATSKDLNTWIVDSETSDEEPMAEPWLEGAGRWCATCSNSEIEHLSQAPRRSRPGEIYIGRWLFIDVAIRSTCGWTPNERIHWNDSLSRDHSACGRLRHWVLLLVCTVVKVRFYKAREWATGRVQDQRGFERVDPQPMLIQFTTVLL